MASDATDPDPLWNGAVILNTGAQWHMLPQSYPNYKTSSTLSNLVLQRDFRLVLTDVANELRENGALDEEECFIDATFVRKVAGRKSDQRSAERHENHGDCGSPWLPPRSPHAANHHEVRLVQLCFDFYMIEAKPEI